MKKILFSVILAAAAMNINAQLVVDSLGRVGIGTDTQVSLLSVGGGGTSDDAAIYCSLLCGRRYGLRVISSRNVTNTIKIRN